MPYQALFGQLLKPETKPSYSNKSCSYHIYKQSVIIRHTLWIMITIRVMYDLCSHLFGLVKAMKTTFGFLTQHAADGSLTFSVQKVAVMLCRLLHEQLPLVGWLNSWLSFKSHNKCKAKYKIFCISVKTLCGYYSVAHSLKRYDHKFKKLSKKKSFLCWHGCSDQWLR